MIEMMDNWVGALESGEMAGVCVLDMSSAFDVVDHSILLKKLRLYGFQEDTVSWYESYSSNRRQTVSINGTLSKFLPVTSGVPQGSILGPLLYTIYTNELPEVLFTENNHDEKQAKEAIFHGGIGVKDTICCYADDTTYT